MVMKGKGGIPSGRARPNKGALKRYLQANYDLYLLLIPGLVFLGIFKYAPLYGITMAFQDFNIFAGVKGSEWVGFANFTKLFKSDDFYLVFINTLLISFYKIILLFPVPIIIAILLNEIKRMVYKRAIQTVIYLPHFLSWVIVGGLFINVLSPSSGLVNNMIQAFGGEPISFMTDNRFFRGVLVFTAGWKEMGWNAIIYIAAIGSINQEMYEAAMIDGAGKLKQIIYITLPSIVSTIVLMFILRIGNLMEAGTEQILMLYNPAVYKTGDVIGTFVYRIGLGKMDYSFSTAVGLFNSVIGFLLVITGNTVSQKLLRKSIW